MPAGRSTFVFDWTPPAANAGNIRIYVAANGANGRSDAFGDRIYTANYTLTPATPPAQPAIRTSPAPVLQVWSDQEVISSGTWLAIYGSNIAAEARSWDEFDFIGNRAPTELDGVKVNINGKPGFISYAAPGQVNVQAPDDTVEGNVQVEVVTEGGTSNAVSVQRKKVSPALLTTPVFNVGGKQYVAALHPDLTTFVGPTNLIAGVPFRPARAGDPIIIYAVGCGSTNPATAAGDLLVAEARPLAQPLQVKFGETVANAQGFLTVGVGLCQLNVTVPNLPSGDIRIDASIDGVATGQTLFTTIQ
jgi:uncharacterized protein (TIGR03437 family)